MQTLTLFQPNVTNLFSQVLWQTGPPYPVEDCSNKWVRESHVDLQDQPFAEHVIQQLRFLLERNKENWKDHLGLLSIVIISAWILELAEVGWQEAACGILLSCRAVAESWMERLSKYLGKCRHLQLRRLKRFDPSLLM